MTPETPPAHRFRLLRYYAMATAGVFVAGALALVLLQRQEEVFFAEAQRQQQMLFMTSQAELARQNEATARASLLAVHEASHVNLTRVVANTLWNTHFGPFAARAQALAAESCRALPTDGREQRRACRQAFGARLKALPGFAEMDVAAYAAMRATKVFKIKVWDLRGITVYSSEHAQVGDDGVGNAGWQRAAAGTPASELTHRDRFSAFEGVVENRDVISTYVPVFAPGSDTVLGVVELYSDVTPFLAQIRDASAAFAQIAAENEASVERTGQAQREEVEESSNRFLLIVGGLFALLYAASLVIVRFGQRIIDRQTLAQEAAARREQLWHREKMAALSAMAANVAHEVGNPLAVISGTAQQLPDPGASRAIVEQTARIAAMMRRIADFADARGDGPEWVDVNAMVQAVCDFLAFDRRLRGITIRFDGEAGLPACELVPDHLNELVMGLLQACAGAQPAPRRIDVDSRTKGSTVVLRLRALAEDGSAVTPDAAAVAVVKRRVEAAGWCLQAEADVLTLTLPASAPPS